MSEFAAAAATPVPAQTLDLCELTDADLLERMALAGTNVAKAHAAFAEFHRRHVAYVYAACERRYQGEAEEIVAETLRRTYQSAPQFDRSILTNVHTPDVARRLVRAWIGQILRWVAADHFADRKRHPPTVTHERINLLPESRRSSSTESSEEVAELIVRVRVIVESLPQREQEIAWIVAHGWSPEHGQLRWSQDDLDAIAKRFGLTRENIRQIRARLIRKLRAQLEPLLNGNSIKG